MEVAKSYEWPPCEFQRFFENLYGVDEGDGIGLPVHVYGFSQVNPTQGVVEVDTEATIKSVSDTHGHPGQIGR